MKVIGNNQFAVAVALADSRDGWHFWRPDVCYSVNCSGVGYELPDKLLASGWVRVAFFTKAQTAQQALGISVSSRFIYWADMLCSWLLLDKFVYEN